MIKTFCDLCEREIPDYNPSIMVQLGVETVKIQLIFSDLNMHVCTYCFIDAVNKLDDRPTAISDFKKGQYERINT